jgi:hypothetical protein
MGILDNLTGGGTAFSTEQITGQADDGVGGQPVPTDYRIGTFDTFGGSVQAGKDVEIAHKRVDADTKARWGYGVSSRPENQGYLYVDLQSSTPNPVHGTIKFYIESSTRRTSKFVRSFDTERLAASKTNRDNMTPLPLQKDVTATEDSYLVVYLNADASNTDQNVDSGQSEAIIPVTEYDLSG